MQDVKECLSPEITEQLNSAIIQYYEHNQEYKSAESAKNLYNSMVKQLMNENNITKHVTPDGIKVSLTTTNKPTFCEDLLITYLRDLDIPGIIKTKEYVDMEVLEDAIYHNQISASDLAPFKEDHITTRLNVSKPKRLVE